mmetsp:Transcript_2444/g.8488  ORF Transcript_2444/g.8488 Transcript_2444/m.8488 type:complete len:203 (+) Transcript_2444:474-1082(+)
MRSKEATCDTTYVNTPPLPLVPSSFLGTRARRLAARATSSRRDVNASLVGVPVPVPLVGIVQTTACTRSSPSAASFSTATCRSSEHPRDAASESAFVASATRSCLCDIFKFTEFTARVSVSAPTRTRTSSSCPARATLSLIKHADAAFFSSRACVSRDCFKTATVSAAVSSAKRSASDPANESAAANDATRFSDRSISFASD